MLRPLLVASAAVALLLTATGCTASTHEADPTAAPPTPSARPAPVDPTQAWIDARVAGMSLEEKAASLLMLHAPGTDPAALRALAEQGVSGLILMGDNVPGTPAELAALTAAVQVDPAARVLIGIDEEGGAVQRLPWDDAAGADALRGLPATATTEAFARRATLLSDAGVDVNFGVVADVTPDPGSFIADRVLGLEPAGSAVRVAAATAGEQGLVATTLKHFPGHGDAPGDSHSSLPQAALGFDAWRAGPAVPFAAGIDAGAEFVMTGHLVYPAVDAAPASLSPRWHEILRDDLGFEGVVVTDDLLMLQRNGMAEFADPGENAVRAVASGADLLLYVLPADPSTVGVSVAGLATSIADAVRSGRLPADRLDDAAARVLAARHAAAS